MCSSPESTVTFPLEKGKEPCLTFMRFRHRFPSGPLPVIAQPCLRSKCKCYHVPALLASEPHTSPTSSCVSGSSCTPPGATTGPTTLQYSTVLGSQSTPIFHASDPLPKLPHLAHHIYTNNSFLPCLSSSLSSERPPLTVPLNPNLLPAPTPWLSKADAEHFFFSLKHLLYIFFVPFGVHLGEKTTYQVVLTGRIKYRKLAKKELRDGKVGN